MKLGELYFELAAYDKNISKTIANAKGELKDLKNEAEELPATFTAAWKEIGRLQKKFTEKSATAGLTGISRVNQEVISTIERLQATRNQLMQDVFKVGAGSETLNMLQGLISRTDEATESIKKYRDVYNDLMVATEQTKKAAADNKAEIQATKRAQKEQAMLLEQSIQLDNAMSGIKQKFSN